MKKKHLKLVAKDGKIIKSKPQATEISYTKLLKYMKRVDRLNNQYHERDSIVGASDELLLTDND